MTFIIKKNTILFHKIYHNYLNVVGQINYNSFYADVMDIVAFLICSGFTER